jgi:hypothetical protein
MKRALISIAGAMLATIAVADDELPRDLFLRCEVKDIASVVTGGKEDVHINKEVKHYRLKDGNFQSTSGHVPLGTGCKLFDGQVVCRFSRTQASKSVQFGPKVEKRESSVMLTRATGEIRLTLQIQTFDGDSIKGTPSFKMVSIGEGICRTVGNPLF